MSFYYTEKASPGWLDKITSMLSGKHNVRIHPGGQWKTDLSKKIVFFNPSDCLRMEKTSVMALLIHETGHIKYSHPVKGEDLVGEKKQAKFEVLNALEDIRVDHLTGLEYRGAWEIIGETQRQCLETARAQVDKALSCVRADDLHGKTNKDDTKKLLLRSVLLGATSDYYYQFNSEGNPTVKELSEKVAQYIPEIVEKKSTGEVLELLRKKVYPILEPLLYDDNLEEDTNRVKVVVSKRGHAHTYNGKESEDPEAIVSHAMLGASGYIGEMKRRLFKTFKDNRMTRYTGRHRTGKLNRKSLYRFKTKDYKLFTRREVPSPSYAMSIWLDVSGSMYDERVDSSKITFALTGAFMLGEALQRLAVPYSIELICGEGKGGFILKEFRKKLDREEAIQQIGKSQSYKGWESFNGAVKRLEDMSKMREEKKLVVVLSDGHFTPVETNRLIQAQKTYKDIHFKGFGYKDVYGQILDESIKDTTEVSGLDDIVQAFRELIPKQ